MASDTNDFRYVTGFTKNRAQAILLSNFGDQYCETKIGLLTQLPCNAEYNDDGGLISEAKNYVEVLPTSSVLDEETGEMVSKPNGYKRISMGAITAQDGYIQNDEELHFPEAVHGWGHIVGFIIESKFKALKKENTSTTQNTNNATYNIDSGVCFIGALPEAYELGADGKYGKEVKEETIALFRKNYIRIGLDHEPPAINI